MMDIIYGFGVEVIGFVQDWFQDYENYFLVINEVTNPNYSLEVLFPLISIVDSVFAAQLVLCIAFGSWLNAVMKWWLLEHRPFWWVRETDYYSEMDRPILRQYHQTCETGPGCPSGHTKITAMVIMLFVMWIVHFINDRKYTSTWWKYIAYPLFTAILASVMMARVFVAAHFPHQVIAGALIGGFLAPALCIYISDPFIWRYGIHKNTKVPKTVFYHICSVVAIIGISFLTYYGLILFGNDPMGTIKLAFRWCEYPASIHVSTTPMYALSQSIGHLLGWAIAVTPQVAKYRHYTKSRSIILATFLALLLWQGISILQQYITKDNAYLFYFMHFSLSAVKVPLFLRVLPYCASWPFGKEKKE